MHWPGIEPGPPAWQARILPLNHQCPCFVQGEPALISAKPKVDYKETSQH